MKEKLIENDPYNNQVILNRQDQLIILQLHTIALYQGLFTSAS